MAEPTGARAGAGSAAGAEPTGDASATGGARVPLRHSLVLRLLGASVLVTVCAVVATAWLTVESTTRAIEQEQGRSLADDVSIYDTLITYAVEHRDWSGVAPTVDELAARTGRRIVLLDPVTRGPVAESAPGPALPGPALPGPSLRDARPSATVDPLDLDPALAGAAATVTSQVANVAATAAGQESNIDARVVGPYRPTDDERAMLREAAEEYLTCVGRDGGTAEIVELPSGRPTVEIGSPAGASTADLIRPAPGPDTGVCAKPEVLEEPTRGEMGPFEELLDLTRTCLSPVVDQIDLTVSAEFTVEVVRALPRVPSDAQLRACVEESRRSQLRPYVAPPVLLFVTDPAAAGPEPTTVNLSTGNLLRIAGVAGLVLLLTVAVTVGVGMRLVRPLRALTEAARAPVDRQHRVPVTTRDEIGYLATALNDLAQRRDQLEQQRRAMVSDVAHELRTPLTNIRAWLEAAQDGLAPVDPRTLTLLTEEATLLQHVIDDLRDLAAADAGTFTLHPEPTFVGDVLTQVVEANQGAATAAGVALRLAVHGDPEVTVDPVRLRQLVGNLVGNAVRHTPAGGSVTVDCAVRGDGWLTVEVVDTGVGIAADDLPKLFDRFWRADASRSRATGGSGLGLPIARQLARAHGGDITVASEPGRGTHVTVRIPAQPPSTRHTSRLLDARTR
ncbi:two-component system sensor histidine kinase BaeS [Micromonospora sp. Llam0]|uniref:sensor histidine kinase n=1 Tax=Micromonospora sp. Llam0 TaxID=2485143 RepID=UPI000F4A52CA|nr:HAMP domain-containing sensor histidine kinase [Micromonospora sp. Llam0]ROO62756.1 two-component system sensor histidine kinase BaeS [Micromonospora sp. Llam0]